MCPSLILLLSPPPQRYALQLNWSLALVQLSLQIQVSMQNTIILPVFKHKKSNCMCGFELYFFLSTLFYRFICYDTLNSCSWFKLLYSISYYYWTMTYLPIFQYQYSDSFCLKFFFYYKAYFSEHSCAYVWNSWTSGTRVGWKTHVHMCSPTPLTFYLFSIWMRVSMHMSRDAW